MQTKEELYQAFITQLLQRIAVNELESMHQSMAEEIKNSALRHFNLMEEGHDVNSSPIVDIKNKMSILRDILPMVKKELSLS
jgi:hypothetical protein